MALPSYQACEVTAFSVSSLTKRNFEQMDDVIVKIPQTWNRMLAAPFLELRMGVDASSGFKVPWEERAMNPGSAS